MFEDLLEQVQYLEGVTIGASVLMLIALMLAGYAVRGIFSVVRGNQELRRKKLDADQEKIKADQEERLVLHKTNDEMLLLYRENLAAMKAAHELSAKRLALEEKRETQRIENEATIVKLTTDNIAAIKENTKTLTAQNDTLGAFIKTVTDSITRIEKVVNEFIATSEQREQRLVEQMVEALMKDLHPTLVAMASVRDTIGRLDEFATREQLDTLIKRLGVIESNILKRIERFEHEKANDGVAAAGTVGDVGAGGDGTGIAAGDGGTAAADDGSVHADIG